MYQATKNLPVHNSTIADNLDIKKNFNFFYIGFAS